MKKIIALVLSIIFILSLTACKTNEGESIGEYVKITQETAKKMIDEGGVIVVDVREQYEFDEVHIEGALLLPLGNIEKDAENVLPDKDAKILVYCRSGRRSAEGAKKLISLGYNNVYDFGGIIDWQYEIVK